jgi:hypothetical protein
MRFLTASFPVHFNFSQGGIGLSLKVAPLETGTLKLTILLTVGNLAK